MFQTLKQFGKRSVLYSAGDFVARGMVFVLTPLYSYFLSPEEYAILSLASVLSALLGCIYAAFSTASISRFYFDFDGQRRKRFLGTIFLVVLVVGGGLTIILELGGTRFFALLFYDVPYDPYLRYAVWTALFVSAARSITIPLLKAGEQVKTYAVITVVQASIKTGIIVLFVVLLSQGVIGILKGQLWAALVMVVPFGVLIARSIRLAFSWSDWKTILLFSLPLLPHHLAHWGLTLSDRIILERYVSLEELGLYSFGYQICLGFRIITDALNSVWFPYFFKNALNQAKQRDISRLITYYWAVVSLLGTVLILLVGPGIRIVAESSYHAAARIAPWVVLGYLMLGLYYVPNNVLYFAKKTERVALGTVLGVGTNIVLNLLLVPLWGSIAAAINTFVAYLVVFLVVFAQASGENVVRYEGVRIAKLFVVCSLTCTIGMLVFFQSPWLHLLLRGAVIVVCVPLGLWLMSFFSRSEIAVIRLAVGRLRGLCIQ